MSQDFLYHRQSIRLGGYDYSQNGLYFVTICTHLRQNLFGEIQNGEMVLNTNGQIAYEELMITPKIRQEIIIDEFQIMPNHIHVIILINNVGACGHTPLHDHTLIAPTHNLGACIGGYKCSVTKKINELRNTPQHKIWQRNYFEHIIRNDNEYFAIKQYIHYNVMNWEKDENNV